MKNLSRHEFLDEARLRVISGQSVGESTPTALSDDIATHPRSSTRSQSVSRARPPLKTRSYAAPPTPSFRSYRPGRIEPTISSRPYTTLEVPGWGPPAVATRQRDLASHIRALAPLAATAAPSQSAGLRLCGAESQCGRCSL